MKYWNKNLKNLSPYIPGEQPGKNDKVIKLNTNENPYPPTPNIKKMLKNLNETRFALYPESDCFTLRKALSDCYQLPVNNIFCGNGSDEILSLIFRCFLSSEDLVLVPYPNYSLYETLAQSHGVPFEYVQSDDNFKIDFNQLLQKESQAIFFSNPNAPTGSFYDINLIYGFCKEYKGLFVLDEAYIDFGGESGIKLISELDNLLVVRTFSKSFSLAGIRLGYVFGSEALIEGFLRMKDSYNVNYLTQMIGYEAIKDYDYMKTNAEDIMSKRDYLTKKLQELGFNITESKSNFVFATHKTVPAKEIYTALKEKGIFIRYFNQPRLDNYIRVTIGKRGELDQFLNITKTILEEKV